MLDRPRQLRESCAERSATDADVPEVHAVHLHLPEGAHRSRVLRADRPLVCQPNETGERCPGKRDAVAVAGVARVAGAADASTRGDQPAGVRADVRGAAACDWSAMPTGDEFGDGADATGGQRALPGRDEGGDVGRRQGRRQNGGCQGQSG